MDRWVLLKQIAADGLLCHVRESCVATQKWEKDFGYFIHDLEAQIAHSFSCSIALYMKSQHELLMTRRKPPQ
jgi:hypothetical protein